MQRARQSVREIDGPGVSRVRVARRSRAPRAGVALRGHSPRTLRVLRGQGDEGTESVQIRCESDVLRSGWPPPDGGGLSKRSHGSQREPTPRDRGRYATKGARTAQKGRRVCAGSEPWRRKTGSFPHRPGFAERESCAESAARPLSPRRRSRHAAAQRRCRRPASRCHGAGPTGRSRRFVPPTPARGRRGGR